MRLLVVIVTAFLLQLLFCFGVGAAAPTSSQPPLLRVGVDTRLLPLAQDVARALEDSGELFVELRAEGSPRLLELVAARPDSFDLLLIEGKEVLTLLVRGALVPSDDAIAIAGDRLALALPASVPDESALSRINGGQIAQVAIPDPERNQDGVNLQQAYRRLFGEERARSLKAMPSSREVIAALLSGEVAAGLLYASDIPVSGAIHSGFIFPEKSHLPVIYYGAVPSKSLLKSPARAFISLILGDKARELLKNNRLYPPPAR